MPNGRERFLAQNCHNSLEQILNNIDDLTGALQAAVDLWSRLEATPNNAVSAEQRGYFIDEAVVPRINDIFRAKFTQIEALHNISSPGDEESYVVHYTGLDTLICILRDFVRDRKGFLRMYDSFHLNDPEEGLFLTHQSGLDIAESETKGSHAYVASFVIFDERDDREFGDEDNLTHWLAYGRGGRGCSIKIPVQHNRFRQVLYGQPDAQHTMDVLDISSILDCIKPLTDIRPAELKRIHQAIWANLERIRYLYKGEAYCYEHECRLVKSVIDVDLANEVTFEPEGQPGSSFRIRHYYENEDLRIDRILTTGSCITLGPLVSRPDNVSLYIRSLLNKAGLGGPEIKFSRVPYREG